MSANTFAHKVNTRKRGLLPAVSSLLEMAFSVFGRYLPQITLLVGDEVARLRIQSMDSIGCVTTLAASFVATRLGAGLDSTVTEI